MRLSKKSPHVSILQGRHNQNLKVTAEMLQLNTNPHDAQLYRFNISSSVGCRSISSRGDSERKHSQRLFATNSRYSPVDQSHTMHSSSGQSISSYQVSDAFSEAASDMDGSTKARIPKLKYTIEQAPIGYLDFVFDELRAAPQTRSKSVQKKHELQMQDMPSHIVVMKQKLQKMQDGIYFKCDNLCKLISKSVEVGGQPPQELFKLSPEQLLQRAMQSQQDSKVVESYFDSLSKRETVEMIEVVKQNLYQLLMSEHGCFILSYFIKKSSSFSNMCQSYCMANLKELSTDKCAVKVMQALAEVSVEFCKVFIVYFIHNYFDLIHHMSTVLLLNKCIMNCEDGDMNYTFFINRLELFIKKSTEVSQGIVYKEAVEEAEILRIMSSVLQRSKGHQRQRLEEILIPHIDWLLRDKISNCCAHKLFYPIFTESRWLLEKQMILDSLDLMFTRKYRKYTLLKVLKDKHLKPMVLEIFDRLVRDISIVFSLLNNEASVYLVIGLILRITDRRKLRQFLDKMETASSLHRSSPHYRKIVLHAESWSSYIEALTNV
jgi:hypothetical protein